jgi:hypothetical protein
VMRKLVWAEGHRACSSGKSEIDPNTFRSCHSITIPENRIMKVQQHSRGKRALVWIHGSLHWIHCRWSHTTDLSLLLRFHCVQVQHGLW